MWSRSRVTASSRHTRHIHPARLRRRHHRRATRRYSRIGRVPSATSLHATTVASNAVLEAKGAENSADHHSGFSRHPGDPRLAHAGVVRHRLDQAARVGRTASASGSNRKDATRRIGGCSAGYCEPGYGDRRCCVRKRRQRRDLPTAQLCQSAHEHAVAAAVQDALPDVAISVSSEILPEIKEYPRTSTTVLNAYVQPVVRAYITALDARLRELAIEAPLQLMQSNGGLASTGFAAESPCPHHRIRSRGRRRWRRRARPASK